MTQPTLPGPKASSVGRPAAADRRAARVLAVVGLAVFLSVLDLFIVNIAFPDLRRDFPGAGLSGLSWVLTAYAIVFAATLVPAGRLGDLYGRRRLFVIGLALLRSAPRCARSRPRSRRSWPRASSRASAPPR